MSKPEEITQRAKVQAQKARAMVEGALEGLMPRRPFASIVKMGLAKVKVGVQKAQQNVQKVQGQTQGQQIGGNVRERLSGFNGFGFLRPQQEQKPQVQYSPEEIRILEERKLQLEEDAKRRALKETEDKKAQQEAEASKRARETIGDVLIGGGS